MQYVKATLITHRKENWSDGTLIEMVIWRLPEPDAERPHGLKYRLYCGRSGECLVRYDNERGKGDHRHYGGREEPYRFTSLSQLLQDFWVDVMQLAGGHDG